MRGVRRKGWVKRVKELDNKSAHIYRSLVLGSSIFGYYYSSRGPSPVADCISIMRTILRDRDLARLSSLCSYFLL